MFGKSIKLFTLFGFTVKIDISWLVILVLVVWSLGAGVFPEKYPNLSTTVHWLMGIAAALGLFASIVFHELWHSLIARRFGLQMKGITLFIFGGVAEMGDQPPSPKAEFWMAIAGPASSAVLGGAFIGVAAISHRVGWGDVATGIFGYLGWINLVLVAFNMLPGFPLDGGRVLRSILWKLKGDLRKATEWASRVGELFGVVLAGLGFISLLTGAAIGGVWFILIGLFVRSAARQAYQQVLVRQYLHGEPVRRFMNDHPITVDPSLPLDRLVQDYVYRYHFKMLPVVNGDHVQGCVSTRDIATIDHSRWAGTTAGQIAVPCDQSNSISPDADAMEALTRLAGSGGSRLMVVEDSHLVGIISLKDLTQLLSLKLQLEPGSRQLAEQADDSLEAKG